LEGVMQAQQRRKFWGFLQASSTNAQSPVAPAVEAQRRDYLLQPAVIDIRVRAAGDAQEMARLAAQGVIEALAARDEDALATLLHPALFSGIGRTPAEWLSLRKEFAHDLTNS